MHEIQPCHIINHVRSLTAEGSNTVEAFREVIYQEGVADGSIGGKTAYLSVSIF